MEGRDHFSDSAAVYVLNGLDDADRRAFEAHLATCASCAAEVHSFAPVISALALTAAGPSPSAGVREKVLKRLGARPRFGASGWAAAASIALAVALGAYAFRLRDRVSTLELRLRQETIRAEAGERRAAEVRRTAFDAQSTLAVLTAPDVARVDLTGQPEAP